MKDYPIEPIDIETEQAHSKLLFVFEKNGYKFFAIILRKKSDLDKNRNRNDENEDFL